MRNGCFSPKARSSSSSDAYGPAISPASGNVASDGKAAWEEDLARFIGLDPTSVFREFAHKTILIYAPDLDDDASAPSGEGPGKIVHRAVAKLAHICNEKNTYGKRFAKAWDEHMNAEMCGNTNKVVLGGSMTCIANSFKMSCLESGMITIFRGTYVSNFIDDKEIIASSNIYVRSATFHLMQLTSQDVLSYGEKFLSDIINLPGVTIHRSTNRKVEVSLADIDVNALQEGQTPNGAEDASKAAVSDHRSHKPDKKVIIIRHEETAVFQREGKGHKHALEFQLTWQISMYIDKEVLEQIYAPFQSLANGSKPEQGVILPLKVDPVVHSLPNPTQEHSDSGVEDHDSPVKRDADAGSGPQHDVPSEGQQAQEEEKDEAESRPTESVRPPKKPPRKFLKPDGIATGQQKDMIGKELVHCNAKITSAVVVKPSRAFMRSASEGKHLMRQLMDILKQRYHVEPVVVKQLDLGDGAPNK